MPSGDWRHTRTMWDGAKSDQGGSDPATLLAFRLNDLSAVRQQLPIETRYTPSPFTLASLRALFSLRRLAQAQYFCVLHRVSFGGAFARALSSDPLSMRLFYLIMHSS